MKRRNNSNNQQIRSTSTEDNMPITDEMLFRFHEYIDSGMYEQDHRVVLRRKQLLLNKIKNIITIFFAILSIPFVIIYTMWNLIKNVILYCCQNRSFPSRTDFKSMLGDNTEYKIECPVCGHSEKFMIGCGHSSDGDGNFSSEMVYCPTCKKPLVKTSVRHQNKSKNKTINENCSACGRKTVPYNVWEKKIKLKCPKCGSQNLTVTDLHSFWGT